MTPRRLYRSRDRQLAGVAGGMAEYLDVDPTVVRILWILAALFSGGLLILAYIILAFVIPETPFPAMQGQGWTPPAAPGASWGPAAASAPAWSPDWAARAASEQRMRERSRGRGLGAGVIVGVILVVFGVIALADSMLPGWFGAAVFGPALVIALGAALLVGSIRRTEDAAATTAGTTTNPAATFAPAAPAGTWAPDIAPAGSDATASGAGYDADATASVDLGHPVDPTDPGQGPDRR